MKFTNEECSLIVRSLFITAHQLRNDAKFLEKQLGHQSVAKHQFDEANKAEKLAERIELEFFGD